jgi:hypothetical protein
MYREKDKSQMSFENFYLPFSGRLDKENRWIKLSQIIPWDEIETMYAGKFSSSQGAPAKPLRMALGALIIKERCGFTDEETVEQIKENPYLQYFIGREEYSSTAPFDASMMVHFRKRLDSETMKEINELIATGKTRTTTKQDDDHDDFGAGTPKKGKLIVDASCMPSDIRYPNDVSLLDEARRKTEAILDELCRAKGIRKPRTYRHKARKDFIRFIHEKKPNGRKVRKAIGKQLRYIRRNLKNIGEMSDFHDVLNHRLSKDLLVIQELYRQQKEMYDAKKHRVESRIVSISQPHVRPIVRGKAGAPVEFGAKVAVSLVNGYTFIDHVSWENFNESQRLKRQVEDYYKRCGCLPESIHADKIYRNRDNRNYCKELGIRLSGPALGRPAELTREEKRQMREDSSVRNSVEGKFGQGKRRFGLSRIMAKLQETSESVIWINIIVMNLERRLAVLLYLFFNRITRHMCHLKQLVESIRLRWAAAF